MSFCNLWPLAWTEIKPNFGYWRSCFSWRIRRHPFFDCSLFKPLYCTFKSSYVCVYVCGRSVNSTTAIHSSRSAAQRPEFSLHQCAHPFIYFFLSINAAKLCIFLRRMPLFLPVGFPFARVHVSAPDTPHVWPCIIQRRRSNNPRSLRTADGIGSDLCDRTERLKLSPSFSFSSVYLFIYFLSGGTLRLRGNIRKKTLKHHATVIHSEDWMLHCVVELDGLESKVNLITP